MSPFSRLLRRLIAAVLLAGWVGGAVASSLLACCAGGEPCCVAATAGHGCLGCDAPVVAAAVSRGVLSTPTQARLTLDVAVVATAAARPWKPPD